MPFATAAISVFLVAVFGAAMVRRLAERFDVVDRPDGEHADRKIHKRPIALLGGVAVILAVCVGMLVFWGELTGGYLLPKHVVGVALGGLVLMLGGALDDKYSLSPAKQIVFPVATALIVIASGIGIDYITNPFGGVLYLDTIQWEVFRRGDTPYSFTLWADLFTLVWLLGMMYTTKFLDGLDGLVSGVTLIGCVVVAWLSMTAVVFQPETALLATIGAAAFAGFLVWNWHPARMFLGESGSLFAGFFMGVLAIISGGKVATTLLVLGIPILDVVWVILRRFVIERRSPFDADRKHLHLRLLDSGLGQRSVALILYAFSIAFGAAALFLESFTKLIALGVLVALMMVLATLLVRHEKKK